MSKWRYALQLWPWLAAICTGLLCAGCFPPFDYWWLCWVALSPLLAAIWFCPRWTKWPGLRPLLLGYVAGLTYFWTVFSWLTTVTAAGWFLLPLYMAIYFALWGWLAGALRPNELKNPWVRSLANLRVAFLLSCGWVGQELLRAEVFSGWGWNSLGTAMHSQLAMIQIAEYTGVAGLSFVACFVNVILLASARRFIAEAKTRVVRPHFDLTLTLTGIVGLMMFGLSMMQVSSPSRSLRVALVEANVPREEKFDPTLAPRIFEKFRRLTAPAIGSSERPQLIVWPESSTPAPVLEDEATYQFVTEFAATAQVDLLLGTIDVEEKRAYNAALLVSNGEPKLQLYRKLHLVPFGEYLPGRSWVPFLAQIVTEVPEDFTPGKDYNVFHLPMTNIAIAPLICFEDTIGELTRHFVLGGAALLANVTNDGWFLRSAGSQQHLANAVFRAVETRRPLVRAANTGVTCVVDTVGRVTNSLRDDTGSYFTEGVLISEVSVPIDNELTFYVRHGDVFAHGCAGIAALTLVYIAVMARRKRAA